MSWWQERFFPDYSSTLNNNITTILIIDCRSKLSVLFTRTIVLLNRDHLPWGCLSDWLWNVQDATKIRILCVFFTSFLLLHCGWRRTLRKCDPIRVELVLREGLVDWGCCGCWRFEKCVRFRIKLTGLRCYIVWSYVKTTCSGWVRVTLPKRRHMRATTN